MLLSRALIVSFSLLSFAAWSCEVFRLEIRRHGNLLYTGSALPIATSRGMVFVSSDHVFPLDVTTQNINNFSFSLSKSGTRWTGNLLRRDWASDIMVFNSTSLLAEGVKKVRLCQPRRVTSSREVLSLVGHPTNAETIVNRTATIADISSSEIRIANPVRLLQIQGATEPGMSGGGLLVNNDGFAGLIIQESNSERNRGAYALPAEFVVERVNELLEKPSLEADLPFTIRRDRLELITNGFRFRLVEAVTPVTTNPVLMQIAAAGGGHPDGIGGRSENSALEVVALSGDPIPPSWQPMARILRRIQNEGGAEMLITHTEDGQPIRNLIQLARLILTNPGAPPPLGFSLKLLNSNPQAPSAESIESLSEKMLTLALELAAIEPSWTDLAQSLRRAYGDSLANGAATTGHKMIEVIQSQQELLTRFPNSHPSGLWNKLIEFRVCQMKLARLLGRRD